MELREDYPVVQICQVLDYARSNVYYQRQAGDNQALCEAIQELAGQYPTYGYRRITALLKRAGWSVNHKRIRRLMDELGLLTKPKRRKKRTTNSQHAYPRFPNRVRELAVTTPDEVWVSDITHIQVRRDDLYLAVIMDVFTRAVRGWHLGRSLGQDLTLIALQQALATHVPLIHHSDQGVQYAAQAYVDLLKQHDVLISMAAVGKPEENGFAERLIRTIKEEEVALSDYLDYADAYARIGQFLEDVYTQKRIHSALGYLTPSEFEAQWHAQQLALAVVH